MALRQALETLRDRLGEMAQRVDDFRTVAGDAASHYAFADPYKYGAEEMEGLLEEATHAVDGSLPSSPDKLELDRIGASMVACHERVLEVTKKLVFGDRISGEHVPGLFSGESFSMLARIGTTPRDRERSDAGRRKATAEDMQEMLDGLSDPLIELHDGLLACWQEFAERATESSFSVRTTNIGQQVSVPVGRATEDVT